MKCTWAHTYFPLLLCRNRKLWILFSVKWWRDVKIFKNLFFRVQHTRLPALTKWEIWKKSRLLRFLSLSISGKRKVAESNLFVILFFALGFCTEEEAPVFIAPLRPKRRGEKRKYGTKERENQAAFFSEAHSYISTSPRNVAREFPI